MLIPFLGPLVVLVVLAVLVTALLPLIARLLSAAERGAAHQVHESADILGRKQEKS